MILLSAICNPFGLNRGFGPYDSALPVKLDCDAAAVGLGAVFPDGTERPIAYASRTSVKIKEKLLIN